MTRIFLLMIFVGLLTSCSHTKTEYWPNGNKKSEIGLTGEKYEGPAKYWHENGNIQTSCTYKNGLIEGKLQSYYPTGAVQAEQHFTLGVLNGSAKSWDVSRNLISEANYRNGILHGRFVEYYPGKTLRLEGNYVNGDHDGLWIYYDPSGLIVGEANFTLGTGIQKAYFSNGITKQLTHYFKNEKDGEEIFYKPDGKIDIINYFEHGKLVRKVKN